MVESRAEPTAELRSRVDTVLFEFLQRQRSCTEPEVGPLLDDLEALVAAGGKRLRPRFCYWGYRAAGGDDGPEIVRVGAALELLHTFALIYDDVMDASPLRRSRPTASASGLSGALLTGLLGFVLADRLLWTSGLDADRLRAVTARFDAMRARAIAGQYLDVKMAKDGAASEAMARRIGALKSAAYSVVDPLAIGAIAARSDEACLARLEAYGRPLGDAFQIADDILGVFGDPDKTGKDRDGDLREGKHTVLLTRTRSLASDEDRAFVDAAVGRSDLEPDAAQRVRDIIVRCGALDATRELVRSLRNQALAALDRAAFERDVVAALRQLATEAALRES